MKVWHGTNQAFDAFDLSALGLANPNSASHTAFFFSRSRDVAESYARHAARSLVLDHHTHQARVEDLLQRANIAMRKGLFDLYEKLTQEVEEMEANAIHAEPAGGRVLLCDLNLENIFEIDGKDPRVRTDLASVLVEAREAGHDAVILLGIEDTPDGAGMPDDHIAVFDPAKIVIVDVIEIGDPETEEPELEEFSL